MRTWILLLAAAPLATSALGAGVWDGDYAGAAKQARQAQTENLAARAARLCAEPSGLNQTEFTLLYEGEGAPGPDNGASTLSFTGGKCSVLDSDHGHPIAPRAVRVYSGGRYRLVLTTFAGESSTSAELQRASGESLDYLGVVDNEKLMGGQPIPLGRTWIPGTTGASLTPRHRRGGPYSRIY